MKRFSLLCALVVALSLFATPQAQADSVGLPLQKETYLGTCTKAGFIKQEKTNATRTPSESDTKSWFYTETTGSTTGELQTRVYVKNSYNRYDQYTLCKKTSTQKTGKKYRIVAPRKYVHKTRYVNYHCDPHCTPLYQHTTGWTPGYCIRGSDEMICMWKD